MLDWIIRKLTGRRPCRFCDRLCPEDILMNGACPPCRRGNMRWLNEMGCVVTWPREEHHAAR